MEGGRGGVKGTAAEAALGAGGRGEGEVRGVSLG